MYITDPGRLTQEMRPSVFGTWAAFWAINPWGEERADLRSAIVAQQVSRGLMKKNVGDWRRDEFMPFAHLDQERETRTLSQRLRSALNAVGIGKKAKS